eukprot:CAMPEP_0182445386 /NCGR_PEP_ID=MMETSP1172-20130603/3528_1 /TAXON_ID=708627 /ORGANISM="Timspurckia oligopyrenoides, Strain CCMP3278" /LENGTH=337 /DNA_ID=CAMNT_0024641151 /DNA_START=342 /DNA_END=1351 /DNA_ORIENTATION=-
MPEHLRLDTAQYPTRLKATSRLVGIGDAHGDLEAFEKVLKQAGLIPSDEQLENDLSLDRHQWMGNDTILVQVGDQLDRGDSERKILHLLKHLKTQAKEKGGDVIALLGNHELMNAQGDFRYVTAGGFEEFTEFDRELDGILDSEVPEEIINSVSVMPGFTRARALALLPGGPTAQMLAEFNIVVVVGEIAFVHGGICKEHLMNLSVEKYALEQLNYETRQFLLGHGPIPSVLDDSNPLVSPVWMRDYSNPRPSQSDCERLKEALDLIGAKSLVVGHTPQASGITCACGGNVWRIDTGLSAAYGGLPECIEFIGASQSPSIITESGKVSPSARAVPER